MRDHGLLEDDSADFADMARRNGLRRPGSGRHNGAAIWAGSAGNDGSRQFEEGRQWRSRSGQVRPRSRPSFGWQLSCLNDSRNNRRRPTESMPRSKGRYGPEHLSRKQQALEARIAELTETGSVELTEPGAFDPGIINAMDLLNE